MAKSLVAGLDRRFFLMGLGATGLMPIACAHNVVQSAEPSPVEGIRLRYVQSNGIRMRIAEAGQGPLVLFAHGWPESWYSWRHQILALAAAGYHVVAPDMRGYGGTDRPEGIENYTVDKICADLVGIIDAVGEKDAVLVGHDWGAIISWAAVRRHPDRFRGLVNMAVPYSGRGPVPPVQGMKAAYGENFFYILYFQEPGVAEAEFNADPRGVIQRLYTSPDTPRAKPEITDPKMSAGGWLPRRGLPTEPVPWFSDADLDYYVSQYEQGFDGGFNYYRNFDRNWELDAPYAEDKIDIPVAFIAGDKDFIIRGASADQLRASMSKWCTDMRQVEVLENTGHWLQQERPEKVNAILLEFLASL